MANTKITSANLDTLTTLVVDDITIDGSTISDSGDLTLDVGGDIVLDAAGGDIILKNAGSTNGNIVLGDATSPTITISSGFNFTLDIGANIILDADSGEIQLKDGGTTFAELVKSGNDFRINQGIQDGDIVFRGNDGGSIITALQLDISDAGQAIFNAGASFEGGKLTINEFTSPSAFTQIRKTNTGSNLAIVSQESIYMLLDENNDQTNRSFFVEHGSGSPGTGTTLFKVQEDGKVGINYGSPSSDLHILGLNGTTSAKITVQTDDTADAKASLLLMSRNASNTNKNWELINDEGYGVAISRTTSGPYGIRKMASNTTVSAGDGWVTLTGFTTSPSDLGGHFSGGIFTAPVTGIYSIGSHFNLYNIGSTNYFLVKGNHLNSSNSGLQEYYVAHTEYTEGSSDSHNAYGYDAYQAINIYMSKGDKYRYEAFSGSSSGQITTASYFSVCLIG